MKNKLTDLNDHLFAQLERLGDEDLDAEGLEREINRSKAITHVAKEVISNANTVLRAEELRRETVGSPRIPSFIGIEHEQSE